MKPIYTLLLLLYITKSEKSKPSFLNYYNSFKFLINTALSNPAQPSISTVISNAKFKSNTICGKGIRICQNTSIQSYNKSTLSNQNSLCNPFNASIICKCPADRNGKYCENLNPINCSVTYLSPNKSQMQCTQTNLTYDYHDDWVGIPPCTSVDNSSVLAFTSSIHCENVVQNRDDNDFSYSINSPKLQIVEPILIYPMIRIPNYNRFSKSVDFLPSNTTYNEEANTIIVNISTAMQNAIAGRLYVEYFIAANDTSISIDQKPLIFALEISGYKVPEEIFEGISTKQIVWICIGCGLCILVLLLVILHCRRECTRRKLYKSE